MIINGIDVRRYGADIADGRNKAPEDDGKL